MIWRSDWIVRRVLEGALNAEQWGALIDPSMPVSKTSCSNALRQKTYQRVEFQECRAS